MKCIYVSNLPVNVDRAFIIKTFQPFGNITKIYIHPNLTWCKIYFDSEESAAQACTLSNVHPHQLDISLHAEEANYGKKTRRVNSQFGSSNTSMSNDYDDLYADAGPTYYNIHGISVVTLTAEDGTLYVSLEDVKQIGFALFEDEKIPKNINFNKQMYDEFKLYLTMKARKYISKMHCKIPDNVIEETKNEIISKYSKNNGPKRNSLPPQLASPVKPNGNPPLLPDPIPSNPPPKPRQSSGFEPQRNNRNSFTPTPEAGTQKSLRRPMTSNADIPSNQQAVKTGDKSRQARNQKMNTDNGMPTNEKENVSPILQNQPTPNVTLHATKATINAVDLPIKQKIKVVVSFIESPDKCWAYKKEDQNKLEALLYDTNTEARNNPDIVPSPGQVCAAMFSGAWYRAIVLQTKPAVKVQYLDFGNFNDEEIISVRELPEKLTSEPALANCLNFATSPRTKLEDMEELDIIATKKNDNNSYQVEEVIEKSRTPEFEQLTPIPSGQTIKTTPKVKPDNGTSWKAKAVQPENECRSSSRQSSVSNASAIQTTKSPSPNSNLTLKEKIQRMSGGKTELRTLNSNRTFVGELFNSDDSGFLQYVQKLGDGSYLCYLVLKRYIDENTALDDISCDLDPDFTGKVGDTVAAYRDDEDDWVRATIMNVDNKSYTVALVDHGQIITTNKIGSLDKKLLEIPEFMCIINPGCIKLFENEEAVSFTATGRNKLTVSLLNEFCNITCTRWDPFQTSKLGKKPNENKVFTAPPPVKVLNDKERILPVIINEGIFLVRNKESNGILAEVKKEIANYNATPLVQNPIVNQLVLCPHDTLSGLSRGIIKTLKENYASIEFIDYGFLDIVPIKNLMTISESLATTHSSLIPAVLKGFEDGKFSDEASECIETYFKEAKKCVAEKHPGNVFDFIIPDATEGARTLSAKLKSLSTGAASDGRLKYADMPKWEVNVNRMENIMCVNIEDNGSVVFISNDNTKSEFCDLNDKISEYIKRNDIRYIPVVDELCLAKFEEEWYRAKVESVNTALEEYQMYYIDYGNTATIPSVDIRKIPQEFTKVPAMAIICYLTEILGNGNQVTKSILNVLKNQITLGESYDVKIIRRINVNQYEAQIPSLSPILLQHLDV